MRKLFGILLSPIFYIAFGLVLIIFHVLQVIALNLFGEKQRQNMANILNLFCVKLLYTLCVVPKFNFNGVNLPQNTPIIFLANHQNMSDIPGLIWYLRKYNPKFVAKIQLGKGIPSLSYNLVKGGSALIDRSNAKQSLSEISRLGSLIHNTNGTAVIFPEGTRSITGEMKTFQHGGVSMMLKKCPNALIVPIAIDGAWKLNQWGAFPMCPFGKVTWTVFNPIDPKDRKVENVVLEAENIIRKHLKQQKND